ncbi:MAG: hypothetical protein JSV86_05220 [Gemmatimonadota bacterium]|nr:MAG: hypothetical protein JSV86_05220 [Gemmatimonadota bacterium]
MYGLHHFRQGALQWTLVERENTSQTAKPYKYLDLSYVDLINDTVVDIETGRVRPEGPWEGTTTMEFGRWCFFLNGHDAPIRWNGREKNPVGFLERPAPPLISIAPENQIGDTGNTSPGLGEFGERFAYGYAVTLISDTGAMSPPSEIAYVAGKNDDTVSAGGTLRKLSALVHIARQASHIRGVLLWRTANVQDVSTVGQQGAALYLLRAFPTGGRMTFIDGTRDERLLEELDRDTVGLFPTGATTMRMFKGYAFADGGPANPTRLRFSSAQHIEQFPDINYLEVGDQTTGRITGLYATKNALVVFKERGIYLVRGAGGSFSVDALTEDIGHVAGQNALKEVPGLGLVFWTEAGPYVLIGALENTGTPTTWRFIGQGLARTWHTRVNTKALRSVRAEVNLNDRELWVLVPEGGDDRATLGLVFHYESSGWSVREGFNAQCLTSTRDHAGVMLLGTTDGYVKTYTHAEDPPSLPEYRSAWLDLGGERTQVRHVTLEGLTVGAELDFEWRVDRHPVGYQAGPEDRRDLDDYERVLPKWGTARLGTDTWYREYPSGVRFDLYQCNGFTMQWRVRGNRLALSGADVLFVPSATHFKERNS